MLDSNPWYVRTRLKTRQLLLLVALDEEGNIHRAADALSMSQPAASKLLRELEEMLDAPLFERMPRGMRLTAASWEGHASAGSAWRRRCCPEGLVHDEMRKYPLAQRTFHGFRRQNQLICNVSRCAIP